MNIPMSIGLAGFALVFGVNGVALAHRLLWRRSPALFWLTSTSIVIAVGYLIGTGTAEDIVRFLWPVPFDPVKTKDFEVYAPCQAPRILGLFLMIGPIMPILLVAVLHYKIKHIWPTLAFSVSALLLYISPLPEKLAHLALPEEMLKLPSHCAQARPRGTPVVTIVRSRFIPWIEAHHKSLSMIFLPLPEHMAKVPLFDVGDQYLEPTARVR